MRIQHAMLFSMLTKDRPASVEAFNTLKVGEAIHARYTEAIAIAVKKP